MNLIRSAYKRLLAFHGPQGWWPIINPANFTSEYQGVTPPNEAEFFEIAVGAILTQNIAWKNVDAALAMLKKKGMLHPASVRRIPLARLAGYIRSTGYYNQKAKKIKNFTEWYRRRKFDYDALRREDPAVLREELRSVNGIGPETADSILLYGLGVKVFVVDAYTGRIFTRLGILSGREKYHEIQNLFHRHFKGTARDYNEYHALIVAHGKDCCKKRPACVECCLFPLCVKNI
ncbi:MAG: hypothetical protein A2176_08215 [Spirochaetes bacterium RBG_13_51_14]|nr:MAG: hypothetical protein A2176_08215 [Spirochaetes bacterium RBG_13_51_14]